MSRMARILSLVLACGLAVACGKREAAFSDAEVTGSYVFAIDSKLETDMNGEKVTSEGRTEVGYRNELVGDTVKVHFDHVLARASVNGELAIDSQMSAAGGRLLTPEGVQEQTLDDAPENVRETILASFGPPIAEITLDAEGRDLERKDVAEEAARSLIQSGLVDNARFFHVPFPSEDTWSVERTFGTGVGNRATGTLEYHKRPAENGRVVVDVTGSMTGRGAQSGQRMENVRLEVSGTQLYDLELRQWVQGRLQVDVSYDLWRAHSPVGSTEGTLEISLRSVEAGAGTDSDAG